MLGGVMAGMMKKLALDDGGLLYLYYLYNLIRYISLRQD